MAPRCAPHERVEEVVHERDQVPADVEGLRVLRLGRDESSLK